MKLRTSHLVTSVSATLLLCSMTSVAALPFFESFEGSWSLASPWSTNGGDGLVSADVSAVKPSAGAKGLIVSNTTVSLAVNTIDASATARSNLWIQVYAKAVQGLSEPSVDSGVAGAFYISTNGAVIAYTGAWVQVTSANAYSSNGYHGFIIHADYASVPKKWDLYGTPNNGSYKTNMTLLAGSLPMAPGAGTSMTNFSVSSGNPAYIDAVAISRAFTSAGATGDKVAVYEHTTNTTLVDFVLPVYAAEYTNSPALGGRLGDDIRSGLVQNDQIYVWSTNSWGPDQYKMSSGAFTVDLDTPLAPAPANELVKLATRLQIYPATARSNSFGFYPYNQATYLAAQKDTTANASGHQESTLLNGSAVQNGFTSLQWCDATTVNGLPISNPAAGLTTGDFMYISKPGQPNNLAQYRWSGSQWQVFQNGLVNDIVVAGARVWVKRQNGTSIYFTYTYN